MIILQKKYDVEYFEELKKEYSYVPKVSKDSKIIFLDVDGCLNSEKFIRANPDIPAGLRVDPETVTRVNKIMEATGAKIVISSSWRTHYLNEPNGFNKLKERFGQFGIKNIVGITPNLRDKRYKEIAAWLRDNEVANFVILDDDANANLHNRLVKTIYATGLLDIHVEEAIKILGEKQ